MILIVKKIIVLFEPILSLPGHENDERRKGYSSLILKELLNEAERRGISKVSLHTSKDGEALYRSFGFSDPIYPVLELGLPR